LCVLRAQTANLAVEQMYSMKLTASNVTGKHQP